MWSERRTVDMIPPFDAWTLARLVCGQPANGELRAVSGPFQGIARRLAALPMEDRLAAWEAFLDGRDDRDEILMALAAIHLEMPAPEVSEDDEAADDWGPIRLGT